MSYSTVSTHKSRVLRKMGLKNMVDLTRLAMKWGLLPVVDESEDSAAGSELELD